MASTDILQSVAELLPSEQRERFLALCARFESVPEDDEFLQILEAIGFMTLLWKKVPAEITALLERTNPISESSHTLTATIRQTVKESIPSYDDLKMISQRLEAHELALKNTLARQTSSAGSKSSFPLIATVLIFVSGLVFGGSFFDFNAFRQWLGL